MGYTKSVICTNVRWGQRLIYYQRDVDTKEKHLNIFVIYILRKVLSFDLTLSMGVVILTYLAS